MIKSREMRWAEHVALQGRRKMHRVLANLNEGGNMDHKAWMRG